MTASPPPVEFPLGPFQPYPANPILRPRGTTWESASVYNPAAIVDEDQVVLLYRAHADDVVSHVGLATSHDGITFDRLPDPVFSPTEPYERKGAEDPRVTRIGDTYYLTYTGWAEDGVRICLATSTDLRTWSKHGPILSDYNSFGDVPHAPTGPWNKAAGILPVPINGRYLMYFGEGSIWHAWSDDLFHWEAAAPEIPVLAPTGFGTFGEHLVEVGPPPLLTSNGLILLLHNAAVKNPDGSVRYSCGQILMSPEDPGTVLAQMMRPWLEPTTEEDHHGLVPNVTFVEGLVRHRETWFAYYGQSDSTLGVATFRSGDRYSDLGLEE